MTNEKQIDEILAEIKTRLMKEIKPEIVNGVWYKYTDNNCKVNFTDFKNKDGYGITTNNFFTNGCWNIKNLTPMSYDEIKDILVKHAVSLGIKEGVTVDLSLLKYRKLAYLGRGSFVYGFDEDSLHFCGYTVYRKGIWATVVKEKTSEEWLSKYRHQFKCLDDFMQTNKLEFIQRK